MSIRNNKTKILSKITVIAMLSSYMYISINKNESYALENENAINKSYTETKIEIGKVKSCDYLNVRSSYNVNTSVVTKIYTNDLIQILDKHNNGWYKIKLSNDIVGWVNGKYIEIQNNNINQDSINDETLNKSKKVVNLAHKQIGKPYVWGANGPNSFDCSGLTSYVYKNSVNINLPRTSREQVNVGKTVSKNNLKAGDLVFFSSTGKGITHVGLYIGDSKMIHSPKPGENVRIDKINTGYYARTYVTGKSIL